MRHIRHYCGAPLLLLAIACNGNSGDSLNVGQEGPGGQGGSGAAEGAAGVSGAAGPAGPGGVGGASSGAGGSAGSEGGAGSAGNASAGGEGGNAGAAGVGGSEQEAGTGGSAGGAGADGCPDADDPRVEYISADPNVCFGDMAGCLPGTAWFYYDHCGCGCVSDGVACGDAICPPGKFCCDHCIGSCADEMSGANCPDDSQPSRMCPGRCDSERCVAGQPCVSCEAGRVCMESEISAGATVEVNASCVDDPCAGEELDCSCAGSICDAMLIEPLSCTLYSHESDLVGPDRDPFFACVGGGKCASPDTRIATATGEKRIADLQVGELVYSMEADRTVLVPIRAIARTPVAHHSVLRISLEDGTRLEISGPHPTAEGLRLDGLSPGDDLDGRRVIAIDRIPYEHQYTYDILPASLTGAYRANGIWLGSTLKR